MNEPMTLIERLRNPQWEGVDAPGNKRRLHIERTLADMEQAAKALEATARLRCDNEHIIISKGVYNRLRDLVISFAAEDNREKNDHEASQRDDRNPRRKRGSVAHST